MNITDLNKLVETGYIKKTKHYKYDLWLYNYTIQTTYERHWNPITLMSRGLILDSEYNIVSRPFPKFFNMEELTPDQIPNLPSRLYKKLDGSLGILYWGENTPYIATRGSFVSEQAVKATYMLHTKYADVISKLDRTKTYLFEIIYPDNRIVVDYKDTDDLFLLGIVDNTTGDEELLDIGFPIVEEIITDMSFLDLKSINTSNEEGFVVKFDNNFRMKIKFENYIKLHSIVTHVSNQDIWGILRNKKSITEYIDLIPDECIDWVINVTNDLQDKFDALLLDCVGVYKKYPTRKETAQYFKTQKYPHVLFGMLDNKDYHTAIWDLIKPEYQKFFS